MSETDHNQPTKDGPRQLTIEQVAEYLQCSTRTVRRMIHRGDLPAYRFGNMRNIRIDSRDLDSARQAVVEEEDLT